ncbi:hypothetical protein ES319_A05G365400v1 [Gossypium barbadense]|uniref:ENTH domain-containing protein n=1 Tax=Gossypium barbadense TaxID=3634 RepID=A0A5J5VZ23_GOSBA|nr:hypothetical protein ES319_A05G365400v1 [Gossypium barbadense]
MQQYLWYIYNYYYGASTRASSGADLQLLGGLLLLLTVSLPFGAPANLFAQLPIIPSGSQHGLKKAIGALKDSTKVGLARGVEVAIVKATDHKEVVPKERHVRSTMFMDGAMNA